jgi:hypothetical protein
MTMDDTRSTGIAELIEPLKVVPGSRVELARDFMFAAAAESKE